MKFFYSSTQVTNHPLVSFCFSSSCTNSCTTLIHHSQCQSLLTSASWAVIHKALSPGCPLVKSSTGWWFLKAWVDNLPYYPPLCRCGYELTKQFNVSVHERREFAPSRNDCYFKPWIPEKSCFKENCITPNKFCEPNNKPFPPTTQPLILILPEFRLRTQKCIAED